ncbi:MAG: hypothetical protein QM689_08675 [Oscillospiraceae bacterium]
MDTFATITSGVSAAIDLAGDCVTFLSANPLCLLYIGAALIPLGFGIFKSAKSAAK